MNAFSGNTSVLSLALVTFGLALPSAPVSSTAKQETTDDLGPERMEQVIESLATKIEDQYIFEELAKEIGAHLRQQLWDGAYEGISLGKLADRLTRDLRSVNNDLHLGVRRIIPRDEREVEISPEESRRRQIENYRRRNFGFAKVEILDGNVGYLDLRSFAPAEIAAETAVAAMGFLANTDALIIDLRNNGGGSPSMVQLLSTYFFEEPTHLNSFELRGQKLIKQFWTLPYAPGKKLVDTPLYILTSGRTFSAAEEFTYNMKNLGRATIVGETTGGGAHPGGTHDIEGLLSVFIPDGRAINPISGTNWEGVGIPAHVKVTQTQALDRAKTLAREGSTGE